MLLSDGLFNYRNFVKIYKIKIIHLFLKEALLIENPVIYCNLIKLEFGQLKIISICSALWVIHLVSTQNVWKN